MTEHPPSLWKAPGQALGAVQDLLRNREDMKAANTKGADLYFHCCANCEAAKRGPVGTFVASELSDLREGIQWVTGRETPREAAADIRANLTGRGAPSQSGFTSCEEACAHLRPKALSDRYRSTR
jgi:hypothetical protein